MTQEQQNNTDLLPKDTNTALRTVMGTVKKLGALYEEETKALHASKTNDFLEIQKKKIIIARDYENGMTQIMARQKELKTADPAVKNKLKAMYAEFQEISNRNMQAIERMQRCTERLGNTIRNAAIKSAQSQRAYSYGDNGALTNAAQRKIVSSGLSETA